MGGAACTHQVCLWMSSYGARHLPDPSDTDLAFGSQPVDRGEVMSYSCLASLVHACLAPRSEAYGPPYTTSNSRRDSYESDV